MNHDLRKRGYFLVGVVGIVVVALFETIGNIDGEYVSLIKTVLYYDRLDRARFSCLYVFPKAVSEWTMLLLPVAGAAAGELFVCDELTSGCYEYLMQRMGRKKYIDRCFWGSIAVCGAVIAAGMLAVALICLGVFPLQPDYLPVGVAEIRMTDYCKTAIGLMGKNILFGAAVLSVSVPLALLWTDKCVILSFLFLFYYTLLQMAGDVVPPLILCAGVGIFYCLAQLFWRERGRL